MSPGSGNLQSPLYQVLPLHLGEVGAAVGFRGGGPRGRGDDGFLAGQVAYQLGHIPYRVDGGTIGQSGLGSVILWDEEGADALTLGL